MKNLFLLITAVSVISVNIVYPINSKSLGENKGKIVFKTINESSQLSLRKKRFSRLKVKIYTYQIKSNKVVKTLSSINDILKKDILEKMLVNRYKVSTIPDRIDN